MANTIKDAEAMLGREEMTSVVMRRNAGRGRRKRCFKLKSGKGRLSVCQYNVVDDGGAPTNDAEFWTEFGLKAKLNTRIHCKKTR